MIVQNDIKDKNNQTTKFTIKFYAPLLKDLGDIPINYDYKRMGPDKSLEREEVSHVLLLYLLFTLALTQILLKNVRLYPKSSFNWSSKNESRFSGGWK